MMIKIKRTGCPDGLKDSPTDGTRYNKKKVVKNLWEMQHEKCCYCEMKIPEEGHLKAVEHFRPKSVFTGLKNDWQNLLLACAQCNGKKSDKFPVELTNNAKETKVVYLKKDSNGKPLIIDPSNPGIDPEEHIDFIVDDKGDYGLIKEKNNSKLGRITIDVIGLGEHFYMRKRMNFYDYILFPTYHMLLIAKNEGKNDLLETYKDKFKIFTSAKGEFAAFARAFAKHKKLDVRFGMRLPIGAET